MVYTSVLEVGSRVAPQAFMLKRASVFGPKHYEREEHILRGELTRMGH